MDEQIRRIICELGVADAVGHTTTPGASVARRLHVHLGIPYEHGLLGRGAEITQQNTHSRWVRFFGLEAIATVNVTEVGC